MRSHISIRGYAHPSIGHPSHMRWNHAIVPFLTKTTISTSENASYDEYPGLVSKNYCSCFETKWLSASQNITSLVKISCPNRFLNQATVYYLSIVSLVSRLIQIQCFLYHSACVNLVLIGYVLFSEIQWIPLLTNSVITIFLSF